MRKILTIALFVGLVGAVPAARAEESYTTQLVEVRSRRGPGTMTATLYLPEPRPSGLVAGVSIVSGGGGSTDGLPWTGIALAEAGYVAIVTGPDSGAPCNAWDRAMLSCSNWNSIDALRSGIDFLLSAANPVPVDPARIGVAGYSLGARAASFVQGADTRVDAAVAFDNLAKDIEGDRGSASGSTAASKLGRFGPVNPRVPSMGQASDSPGTTAPLDTDPDIKKDAYHYWKGHGVPAMQLVFRGTGHLTYGSNATWSPRFAYYTVAWFDRWLRDDATATARLLTGTVDGQPRNDLLSTDFRSALYMPGEGIDCEDLTAC